MNYLTQIKEALANLFSAKLRSFLAVLGILVGTASVVALISSGELATQAALAQFKVLGTNLMSANFFMSGEPSSSQQQKLTLEEAEHIQTINPDITEVAPYIVLFNPVSYGGHQLQATVIGTTQNLQSAIKISLQQGRFISFLDKGQRFCVIGQALFQQIKAQGAWDPVGKQIQIGPQVFTIIGVMQNWPENAFFDSDLNQSIIIPIESAQLLSPYATIQNMVFRLLPNANIDGVENSINKYLQTVVPQLKIYMRSAKQIINSMQNQHKIFTLMLGSIGGIALLVGGIGVMNIMLVSVAERRREIGIRKAIGARRYDIQLLFLFEAIVLALFGGMLGVIVGVIASYIIALFTGWGFALFLWPIVLGFIVSAATGVFFGFYPAVRAARLDPIVCLRTDA